MTESRSFSWSFLSRFDILLAVYNGEKRGGTAATVRYALKAERKIIYIIPDSRKVIEWEPTPPPAHT